MEKAKLIESRLSDFTKLAQGCTLCGHRCGVDRLNGEEGACRQTGNNAGISSYLKHFGEEPPLSASSGSGTVFFCGCSLSCVYCQNYQISRLNEGREYGTEEIAGIFLKLEKDGAQNINLVTPTHIMHIIIKSLMLAYEAGLSLPLVYNSSGYDSLELLRLLEGVVDIYLPDIKYFSSDNAKRYSGATSYPETARAAIKEMYRQTKGNIISPESKRAERGMIIRHLVLPDDIAMSYDALIWLKDEGMTDVTLSIMNQYAPKYRALEYEELSRSIRKGEYDDLVDYALTLGFENLLIQSSESRDVYFPDFRKELPFDMDA